jgi:hypothetical protein
MDRIFTTLQRLKDGCWEVLSSRFAGWTKPHISSLPLSTLADLGRSKSELIAENVYWLLGSSVQKQARRD